SVRLVAPATSGVASDAGGIKTCPCGFVGFVAAVTGNSGAAALATAFCPSIPDNQSTNLLAAAKRRAPLSIEIAPISNAAPSLGNTVIRPSSSLDTRLTETAVLPE